MSCPTDLPSSKVPFCREICRCHCQCKEPPDEKNGELVSPAPLFLSSTLCDTFVAFVDGSESHKCTNHSLALYAVHYCSVLRPQASTTSTPLSLLSHSCCPPRHRRLMYGFFLQNLYWWVCTMTARILVVVSVGLDMIDDQRCSVDVCQRSQKYVSSISELSFFFALFQFLSFSFPL